MDALRRRSIINNIKRDARISLTLKRFKDEIKYGIRDKDLILIALEQFLGEK